MGKAQTPQETKTKNTVEEVKEALKFWKNQAEAEKEEAAIQRLLKARLRQKMMQERVDKRNLVMTLARQMMNFQDDNRMADSDVVEDIALQLNLGDDVREMVKEVKIKRLESQIKELQK